MAAGAHPTLQERTTRAMLAHCGMPWEPGVLAFHATQRTVSTASLAQVSCRAWQHSAGRASGRYSMRARLQPAVEAAYLLRC